jgi:phosphoserine phosphatase
MEEIKLVVFDIDKTLTEGYSWEKLNLALGVTQDEDRFLYDLHAAGKINYQTWVDRLLPIYQERGNPTRKRIFEILGKCTFFPGAREAVEFLKDEGYEIALISGGPDIAVDAVAKELGVSLKADNGAFEFDEEGRLVHIQTHGEDALVKLGQLEQICKRLGITLENCVCVGDGSNDKILFEATGHGITFSDSRCASLHGCCWKTIDTLFDLKTVLKRS